MLLYASVLLVPQVVVAEPVPRVLDIRVGAYSDKTRLVIDLSKPVKRFSTQVLSDPARVVVDLDESVWGIQGAPDLKSTKTTIKNIRYGVYQPGTSRIVFDFQRDVVIDTAFSLAANADRPYRIVIDTKEGVGEVSMLQKINNVLRPRSKPPVQSYLLGKAEQKLAQAPVPLVKPADLLDIYRPKPVVVLDAGHGGVDPGAIRAGIREKDIVLRFTKAFAEALRRSKNFTVIETRTSDTYLTLAQRVEVGAKNRADLFLSFHADTVPEGKASGMSLFTLSDSGSDDEATELATMENKEEFLPDFGLSDENIDISQIIIDLSQRQKIEASEKLAATFVRHLRHTDIKLHKRPVRKAGFRVLKAPNTPALLIELGFLSDPDDRRNLQDPEWQETVIDTMAQALNDWYDQQTQSMPLVARNN